LTSISEQNLRELVNLALQSKEAAISFLNEIAGELSEEERRGLNLAIAGMGGSNSKFEEGQLQSLRLRLKQLIGLPVADNLDISFARAWLTYIDSGLSVSEGNVDAEDDEPHNDVGTDSVGVGSSAGGPASTSTEQYADHVKENKYDDTKQRVLGVKKTRDNSRRSSKGRSRIV
jgi:hypothetical protein